MIPTVVVPPIVVAVLSVLAARARARRQGTVFPLRRAVLVVVLAGGAGALVAVVVDLALQGVT